MIFVLMCIGLIAVAAASPAAAYRYSGGAHQLGDLHYFKRQLMWVMLGLPVMLGVSMLSRKWALRLALAGTLMFILLDRQSVVSGTRVSVRVALGGRSVINKNIHYKSLQLLFTNYSH